MTGHLSISSGKIFIGLFSVCIWVVFIITIPWKDQVMTVDVKHYNLTTEGILHRTHSKQVLGLQKTAKLIQVIKNKEPDGLQQNSKTPTFQHDSEIFSIPHKINKNIFLYNRIPKCGSSTLLSAFKKMAEVSNYTSNTSVIYFQQVLSNVSLKKFVEDLVKLQSTVNESLVYDRHIHYVDFERFGYKNPIYFNMVRDPFEQAMSWYYYMFARQNHSFITQRQREAFRRKHKWKTYGKCIEEYRNTSTGLKEMCFLDTSLYVSWFCGHDAHCINMDIALPIAKQHIDKYTLIGLTEELSLSLTALETLVPSYFKHISKFYDSTVRVNAALGATNVYPSTELVNFVKVKLKYSYEIYNFIKQKFHKTLKDLRIVKLP